MSSICVKRLSKELLELQTKDAPVGIQLLQADDFVNWKLSIEVLGESLYKGEVFALSFKFSNHYPISSPEVVFVCDDRYQAPVHPHVYSNGHICASILGHEWSPVLNVAAVCITLQSMLASCKKKERPPDNDRYVRNAPANPKQTRFHYDDDTV